MGRPTYSKRIETAGAALVIILAFVVLLTGLVVAFLSRATVERQTSSGSANDAKADILARSSLAVIIGELKQEIDSSSAKTTNNGTTLYTPNSAISVLPMRSGVPAGTSFANMVRRSVHQGDVTAASGDTSQASDINSEAHPSLNGRSVSKARWNAHYLIAKANSGNDATDPDINFVSPDWVIATRSGISVEADSDVATIRDPTTANFALGRFAYVIYDEGGLLDVNVAGYPTDASGTLGTTAPVGTKGCLALADFTQVIPGSATIAEKQAAANKFIGWRNYATGSPGGSFPAFTFSAAAGANWYSNFVTANTSGFLKISSTNSTGATDQAFLSRQQLIKLRRSANTNVNALQYLGTFSRELNIPTWTSAATRRVSFGFVRRDGTTAKIGEPLIRRFPISEIGWLGPSGVLAPGTAATVKRDFGLIWNTDHWDYLGASGTSLAAAIPPITANQEPDFFQLLALAKPTATIQQILTTGACLIDQFDGPATDAGNFTTRIDYAGPPTPPSTTNAIAWGMESVSPPQPTGAPTPRNPLLLNRPFKNIGEFGYAFRDITLPAPAPTPGTLDFSATGSTDGAILDLFAASAAYLRAGVVNLNTRQELVLSAIISLTRASEPSTAISSAKRNSTAAALVAATSANPATSRQELARLTTDSGLTLGGLSAAALEEYKELVARALADTIQTRTWNLLIDVIAQSGRFPPTATGLADFVVEGEKRYWLHVAIDRFTGEVIDQQLEAVYE